VVKATGTGPGPVLGFRLACGCLISKPISIFYITLFILDDD